MNALFANANVAWRSGWRSHGARLIVILGLVLVAIAYLAGAFSLRQPMVVALDTGFSGMRILAVLLGLFWVQESVAKDLERRTILFSLAYPMSRSAYLCGRFLGITALLAVALLGFGLLVELMAHVAVWGYADSSRPEFGWRYWVVVAGIFFDVSVVIAFAVWLSSLAETPFLPLLLGLGFAIAGHMIGPVLDYLLNSPYADINLIQSQLPWLGTIRLVLPDLSRLDWRTVALYGQPLDKTLVVQAVLMCIGYATLMLSLAYLHFSRREFK